jgi:pyruvate dehydrogenase E2 component (dihydrolipoamide acetyltransferase)
MATEIVMPQLGLTMTEGTVVKWLKKVGDQIQKGDVLFEVETDKVTQEVSAFDEGVLVQIVVGEGVAVPVGTVIAYLGDRVTGRVGDGESGRRGHAETRRCDGLPKLPLPEGEGRGEGSGEGLGEGIPRSSPVGILRSSPAARNLARKLGVDIAILKGNGPGGRIIEADVRRAAEAEAGDGGQGSGVRIPSYVSTPAVQVPSSGAQPPAPAQITELRGVKKVVAERMAQSFSTAPHFYLTVEVDATKLVALREQLAAAIQRRQGVDVTVTDLLVKAVAIALKEHPEANAAWAGNGYRLNQGVNLGLAVAMSDGLVVPVIRGADRLSLGEVARKRSDLVDRARTGQLTLPELEGGSFTLSNLGMFGIDLFQAIVNPPQAAILAVGRIKDRVVAVDGQPAVRPTMFVTLSSDHRILDGAMAAGFLARVVQLLESPVELLLAESEG